MSNAVSPTTVDLKKGVPLTVSEFRNRVDHFRDAFRAIFNLQTELYRFGPNHKLEIKNHKIGRKDINSFLKAALSQMGDLPKLYALKKKKPPRQNSKLSALFYVSDQLVAFYDGADLGLSDPEDEKSSPLVSEIGLLTKDHMANSGILTSLFSRYVDENGLRSDKEDRKGRFVPDQRMKTSLSTSNPILFGEDLSERELPEGLSSDKQEKIDEDSALGSKSAFARIDGRTKKNTTDLVYDKKRGLMFLALMIFSNYYRIQDAYLSEDERAATKDPEKVEEAKRVQGMLTAATKWYRNQKKHASK